MNNTRPIYVIAQDIRRDWKNVSYCALPYLNAMFQLDKITDSFGCDSARSVVSYFLANAVSWRGVTARVIKKELNALIKN
jgi:hypothetical protein